MRQTTMKAIQVLRRIYEFLAAHLMATALGGTTKPVEALRASVDRLSAHAVDQDVKDRAYRASATAARRRAQSLRTEFMRPVARMARTLFPEDAEILRALAMPKARDYERLINGALAMADHSEEHKARFVEAGFGDDFVESLRKAAADLRTALDEKSAHFGKRAAATAGLADELGRCRDFVRLLDDMVSPGFRATPERLAEWRTLSRFVQAKRVAEASGAPALSTTPNAASPVVAEAPAATTVTLPVVTTLTSTATPELAAVDRAA